MNHRLEQLKEVITTSGIECKVHAHDYSKDALPTDGFAQHPVPYFVKSQDYLEFNDKRLYLPISYDNCDYVFLQALQTVQGLLS